jgi:hypothetical protein
MNNSPGDHARSALAISFLQMCPVHGIFNKSSGAALDFIQCVFDKLQFNTAMVSTAKVETNVLSLALGSTEAAALVLLNRNKCQAELFKFLRLPQNRYATIFTHSQGNLILSNVLQAIRAVDGDSALTGRVIHTFGSAAQNWPSGLKRFDHAFTFDYVNFLTTFPFTGNYSKVWMPEDSSNPFTHNFMEYARLDAAFVVNRFVTGGKYVTFSMDEQGLAECLVEMGVNTRRVKAVFEYLKFNHWSDADDVAMKYLALLGQSARIEGVVNSDAQLRQLLIGILQHKGRPGWTTSAESAAIKKLQGGR